MTKNVVALVVAGLILYVITQANKRGSSVHRAHRQSQTTDRGNVSAGAAQESATSGSYGGR